MPKDLEGNPDIFPVQRTIVAGDRRGGQQESCYQDAADRTQWLHDRVTFIDPDKSGVRRLRTVTSIAELRATADHPDRTVCLVKALGLFMYIGEDTTDEEEPHTIKPADVVGAGRWVCGRGALNVPNGFPKLNANGRVPNDRLEASEGAPKIKGSHIAHGLIDLYTSSSPGPFYTTWHEYVDVPACQPSFELLVGDVVIIQGSAQQQQESGEPVVHVTRWAVVTPEGLEAAVAGSEVHRAPSPAPGDTVIKANGGNLSTNTHYVATASGRHTFKMQHRVSNGNVMVSITRLNVVAMQRRP